MCQRLNAKRETVYIYIKRKKKSIKRQTFPWLLCDTRDGRDFFFLLHRLLCPKTSLLSPPTITIKKQRIRMKFKFSRHKVRVIIKKKKKS